MASYGTRSYSFPAVLAWGLLVVPAARSPAEGLPENLAVKARASASSQFNDSYRPQMAVRGVLPSDVQSDGTDWAARGTQNGWFELQWKEPVEAAQILYYARTTSPLLECFKDYAVYLNGEAQPAVRGTLEHRRGPQKIAVPKRRVTRLRIEFLSSHPGAINPGAGEIAVYPEPVTDAELEAMSIPPEEMNILEIAPRRWGSPASKLTEILRSGHPDKDGKPQVSVPEQDRRRVYLWMDLNIPYYGTSSSNHKARLGSRRMLPADLDSTLSEVASRRCASCHATGVPRKFYTRVTRPEKNSFLLAPLAIAAGGSGKCGKPVFPSTADPDYQKILHTFAPIHALLKERPRADMEGFQVMCDPHRP